MVNLLKLYIDGEPHLVTFNEIVHPVHTMYHVELDNGYENIFFSDVETGQWVEQDLGFTRLAAMIGDHLFHALPARQFVTKELSWYCSYCNDQRVAFGFHKDLSGGFYVYEIFAPNKRYMFTLIRLQSDVWQLFKIPGSGWDYYERYIHEIPFILETCRL